MKAKKLLNTCAAYFVALLIPLALVACASFQQNLGSEKIVVQYATMKFIEADKANLPERAAKIREVASEAKTFFDSSTATVPLLEQAVRDRIAPLQLSPADRVLATALIDTVVTELQTRVGKGLVPPDQVYQVSTVLGWIMDATEFYP